MRLQGKRFVTAVARNTWDRGDEVDNRRKCRSDFCVDGVQGRRGQLWERVQRRVGVPARSKGKGARLVLKSIDERLGRQNEFRRLDGKLSRGEAKKAAVDLSLARVEKRHEEIARGQATTTGCLTRHGFQRRGADEWNLPRETDGPRRGERHPQAGERSWAQADNHGAELVERMSRAAKHGLDLTGKQGRMRGRRRIRAHLQNAIDAYDALYENLFDLIISDIMMPGVDGFTFAKTVREQNEDIPILFMTARDDIASKQRGFRIGVDDYMVKPIDLDELFLRIGALLRRAKIASSRKIEIGRFVMDADEHTAYLRDEEIALTNREFSILYKLLSYPKKTFTRTQLMDEFWDADTETAPRAVDVYMTKLRSKLADCEDFEIKTVHGLGYKAVIK